MGKSTAQASFEEDESIHCCGNIASECWVQRRTRGLAFRHDGQYGCDVVDALEFQFSPSPSTGQKVVLLVSEFGVD